MLLTIRVSFAIIFSAFALWSQTQYADGDIFPKVVELEQREHPAFSLSDKWRLPQETEPFAFTLTPPVRLSPERSSDAEAFNFAGEAVSPSTTQATSSQAPSSRPAASGISHAYFVRRKIHKYASFATMPLIVSQAIVGQKLMDRTGGESGSLRSAHSALTAGLGVLFGVESVTGVWNMFEARKNHVKSKRHLVHGILMLAADAGFVATAAMAPGRDEEGRQIRASNRASAHRAVGFASLGVATVGYIYMLIAK